MESALYPVLKDHSLTITEANAVVNRIFNALQDGEANAMAVVEELGFMAKVNDLLRKKPGFTQLMRERIIAALPPEETGADGLTPVEGSASAAPGRAQFNLKTTGVRYDYASTGDPLWRFLSNRIEADTEARKERETLLKALKSKQVMRVDLPDGNAEVATIHPPTSSGTESFEMRLAK